MNLHKGSLLLLIGLITLISLGYVGAYTLMPRNEVMLERAKGYVERRVEVEGQQYADHVHNKVSYVEDEHNNPFIRFFMGTFKGWLEEKFSAGLLAWRQESEHGSADEDNLPTEQEQVAVADESEQLAPAGSNNQEQEGFTTQTNNQAPVDSDSVDDLYKQSAQVKLPDDVDYYQLQRGRIDLTAVKKKWLERVNNEREKRGLAPYKINPILNKTATDWSYSMREKGNADHKRYKNSSYYDYEQITNRFAERDVTFETINRSTYTENVGYAWFNCQKSDCTKDAIESVRRIFDYFMSEEGKEYDVHFRTLMHPRYKEIGFGLVVDEENNWIYSVQHYGTRVE